MVATDTHAEAADLELIAALLSANGSTLDYAEWSQILAQFPARTRRVVILHGLMGMTFPQIGERLYVSYGRCDQIWREALTKLAKLAPQLRTRNPQPRTNDRNHGRVRTAKVIA